MYRNELSRIPPALREQTAPEDLSSRPSISSSSSQSSLCGEERKPNKLLVFCDIVLKHVNYPQAFREPLLEERGASSSEESKSAILVKNERASESPLNSVGESARESTRSSTSSTDSVLAELDPEEVDKETFESVSCWCGKPFAGRPMIECDLCLVWFHMSCEQVRRNNIPQRFHCSRCKEAGRRRKKRPAKEDSPRKGPKKKRKSAPAALTNPGMACNSVPGGKLPATSHLPEELSSSAGVQQQGRRRRSSAISQRSGMSGADDFPHSSESQKEKRKSSSSSGQSARPRSYHRHHKSPRKSAKRKSKDGVGAGAIPSVFTGPPSYQNWEDGASSVPLPVTLVGAGSSRQSPPVLPCYATGGPLRSESSAELLTPSGLSQVGGDPVGLFSSSAPPRSTFSVGLPVLQSQVTGETVITPRMSSESAENQRHRKSSSRPSSHHKRDKHSKHSSKSHHRHKHHRHHHKSSSSLPASPENSSTADQGPPSISSVATPVITSAHRVHNHL